MSASGPSSSSQSQSDNRVTSADSSRAIGNNKGPVATDGAVQLGNNSKLNTGTELILSGKSSYSYAPSTTTTTNVTGLDPAAVASTLEKVAQIQATASQGTSPSTTIISTPGQTADLSGLGNSISGAITNALGTTKSATPSWLLWAVGGFAVLGLIFFLRRRK